MAEEPESYQSMRSHADVHAFLVSYADRFYAEVPDHVSRKEPWNGTSRGHVVKLKPDLRLALTRDRSVLIDCPEAMFKPEVGLITGWLTGLRT